MQLCLFQSNNNFHSAWLHKIALAACAHSKMLNNELLYPFTYFLQSARTRARYRFVFVALPLGVLLFIFIPLFRFFYSILFCVVSIYFLCILSHSVAFHRFAMVFALVAVCSPKEWSFASNAVNIHIPNAHMIHAIQHFQPKSNTQKWFLHFFRLVSRWSSTWMDCH